MIFQRSILREKITVAAVILLTLLTITSVLLLVRALRSAALGNLALDGVLQIMLITTLAYFPLLVVVSVIVAITLTVSRLYRDSEMAVWQASGLGALSLLRPVAMLVVPMFLFVLFINTLLTPWTTQQLAQYRNQSNIQELSLIKNGTFRSAEKGERVFFVDQVMVTDKVPTFKNIFVAQKNEQGTTLIVAQHANVQNAFDNRAFLVLKNGLQYDDKPSEQVFQSMRYDQYGFSLDEFTKLKIADVNTVPIDQRTTTALWNDPKPEAKAEIYRRASDAFMIVPMALLALVFGYVKPRGTRTIGVLAGLLLFLIYLNLVKLGESSINNASWTMTQAVVWVHGGFTLLALAALCYRYYSWRITGRSWFRLRSKQGAI